jgi:hypothetical protein
MDARTESLAALEWLEREVDEIEAEFLAQRNLLEGEGRDEELSEILLWAARQRALIETMRTQLEQLRL